MSLLQLSAAELRQQLESRKLSSREVAQAFLDQIAKTDSRIDAFLSVDPDRSLARAKEIDDRRASGKEPGLLR